MQELRSREEELTKAAMEQKMQEEFLRKREQELAEREIELVERELNIMILQQIMNKPTPKKRKGKFKKSRLKLLKSGGKNISTPSGINWINSIHSYSERTLFTLLWRKCAESLFSELNYQYINYGHFQLILMQ